MYSSRIFLKLAYLPVKGRELMKYTKLVMEIFIWLCLLKHLQNSILYTVFFSFVTVLNSFLKKSTKSASSIELKR